MSDTILGVRNDGRLKYSWDVDENTVDPELSTEEKTVYAYAGHDSVLWKNLREQFPEELQAAYRRIRERMSNSTIFKMFDDEQSAKFCERIYNLDALNKYVEPKTLGVEVNQDGSVTNVKYSYLEAMQGSRKSHRHWWITNRMGLFDARYSTGQYTATDISFKGNSAAGATVKELRFVISILNSVVKVIQWCIKRLLKTWNGVILITRWPTLEQYSTCTVVNG